MSVAAELHDRYRDVRKRLMGKPVREVLEKLPQLDGPLEIIRASSIEEVNRKQTLAERQAEVIKRAIDNFGHTPSSNNHAIIRAVAKKHGFTYKDIIGTSRNRNVILARREAIHAVKLECPKKSLPDLGRLFGGKDHTTILHHLRKPCPNVYRPNQDMPDWDRLANPAQKELSV